MINTFNLEQNLLTFPSERDILTGGRRGVSAMEDGWLDGRLLTCPRVSVHAAPLLVPTTQATQVDTTGETESGHATCTTGRWDLGHSGRSCIRDSGKHYPTDH